MWQRDGWDARVRIGVLTAHFAIGPEAEFAAMAPPGVTIHASRVKLGVAMPKSAADPGIALDPVRQFAEPPEVDDATELLAAAKPHAIAYGFFSSSYVLGIAGDRALASRLEARAGGIPVVIPGLASLAAFRALGAGRLALVEPPWFTPELDRLGAEYFRKGGIEVVYTAPADLPKGQHDQNPGRLYHWVRSVVPKTADVILIGGNGFRAVGAIAALEEDLGRPVLTANQVVFWAALRRAGLHALVTDYGRIFAQPLPREEDAFTDIHGG